MLTTLVGWLVLLASLAVFAAIGLRQRPDRDLDDFLTARGSQTAGPLALSFFASGLGAWILFAPPEIGALAGIDAVVGYGLAAAAPFVVYALVGPRLRRIVPSGQALTEFLRIRFGRGFAGYVSLVSVLYMAVFLTAELVAVAGIAEILAGVPRIGTILAVAVVTLAYTTYGGLRASLRTDRWQGWLVLALVALAGVAIVSGLDSPGTTWRDSGLLGVDRPGIEAAITLVIAVTAANLLHQGYWQRVWSASDDQALRRGALVGAAATVPVVLVVGAFGILAAGAGAAEVPALSVFALTAELPDVIVIGVMGLGVALVASSVDTLENALVSLVAAERPATTDLRGARVLTVLIMVPVTGVALVAGSVLQLFLIADLLAAAIVVPSLLGLWRRATGAAALAGGIAGLVGAFVGGLVERGDLAGAVDAVTFADTVPTLPPFLGALLGSAGVAILVSLLSSPSGDLDSLEERLPRRTPTGAGSR
ncbi:MAG: hypothetical protein R3343_04610 [Nitriliruptorales bacterium]|nr:hypothetical protein [Nitriliruptorales bacterium]